VSKVKEEGWQEHCTGTFHFYPKNRDVSYCGSVYRNSSCNGPSPIYPKYAMYRACSHCIGVDLVKPAKWQKQSRASR
jgi:hypothetical protein